MVRIVIAIVCAFVLGLILGRVFIPMLRALKAGQSIREIGPSWHNTKSGTPTIGGIIFIAAMLVSVFAGIGNAERLHNLTGKVKEAGVIQHVDLGLVILHGNHGGGDGILSLGFFGVEVGDGVAGGDLAHTVNSLGQK